jgi:hypothetical protein
MNWKNTSTLFICMLVLGSLIFVPAMASADVDVPNCSIGKIGFDPRFEGPPVQLDDLSDTNWTGVRQFYLSSELGNQGLAVLLTAYSLGETVWVRIAGDASSGSLVKIIFVNKSQ